MGSGRQSWTKINKPINPPPFRGWIGWGALCLLFVLITGTLSSANPTSLNVIPTADVLPDRNATIDMQISGGNTPSGYGFMNFFQTQFGIGDNIEFGFDATLGPNKGNSWNAKYRIYEETARRPAVAVGLLTTAPDLGNPFYVVAFKSDGQARLHFGAIQLNDSIRAMLGFDIWRSDPIVFQADYISGQGAYTSLGIVLNAPNGFYLNVAQLIGNSSNAPNAYLAILGWSGAY